MRKIILLFVFSLCFLYSKAGDYVGGDIGWQSVGKDSFLITANIYWACGATSTPSASLLKIKDCKYKAVTLSTSPTISSGKDVTPVCKGQCTPCSGSCSLTYGVKKYTISMIFVPPAGSTCCDYYFYYEQVDHSSGILTGASGERSYVEAKLNTCLKTPDNSPIFTGDPFILAFMNQATRFNFGGYDTDRDSPGNADSLVYTLDKSIQKSADTAGGVPTYSDWSKPYNYNLPLKFDSFPYVNALWNPPSCEGFHLDPDMGDLYFKSTSTIVTIASIRVDEYAKDSLGKPFLKGYTHRDIQINVIKGSNNQPIITGIDSTDYSYGAMIAGRQNCIIINAHGGATSDTLSMGWDSAISGASLSVTKTSRYQLVGTMCWNPKISDVRTYPYFFSVNSSNQNCPYLPKSSRGYLITVLPPFTISKTINCNSIKLSVIPSYAFGKMKSINWTGDDSLRSGFDTVTHQYKKSGTYKYYVSVKDTAGNTFTDSGAIIINSLPAPAISLQGKDTLISSIKGKKSCNWYRNDSLLKSDSCYYVPTLSGNYSVSYVDSICESDRSNNFYFNITGITKEENKSGIKIYPNPSTGFIRIELINPTLSNIKLTDITGKELFSFKVNSSYELDLRTFPKGIYFLQVQNENQSTFEKIILQ